MKVLLLAAGRSKRMKPIEDKNFLNFLGKPLLQHQIELLLQCGLDDIIVVCSKYNKDRIADLAKDICTKIKTVEQEDLDMGMCGAVLSAKNLIGEEPVLVFSSNDVVEKKAFQNISRAFYNGGATSYLLGYKVSSYFPGGYLEVGDDNLIKNIVEKPGEGNEPSNLINLVVHLHSDPLLLISYLEKTGSNKDDRYEVALASMMRDGINFKAVEYDGAWEPIKFPWHIKNVFKHYFNHSDKFISDDAKISKNAILNGDLIIESGVKVFDGAILNGPCYIGKNTIIASNALVRESNIGEDCVIGFSTEVARSYLGNNVWTHSNYIGDSIIENNVSFGAGSVTGNLRLDESNIKVDFEGDKIDTGGNKFGVVMGSNIRVGVNTSFMPGVKVGGNSFIGAGIVISKNIPDKSFVRGSLDIKISENNQMVDNDREEFKNNL